MSAKRNGENSTSEESSSDSSNQAGSEFSDLTLFGAAISPLSRTGTVRRASAPKKVQTLAENPEEPEFSTKPGKCNPMNPEPSRYRRSLDSAYRLSLDSISEYKTKRSFSSKSSFSSSSLPTSRDSSSMDSSVYSDSVENAVRSASNAKSDEKTLPSASLSYFSWIENVNTDFFGSETTLTDNQAEIDSKVGEWNNFWLNYNSARSNKYGVSSPSPYLSNSNEDRTTDDYSDAKSTCSTSHRGDFEKSYTSDVVFSLEEIQEAVKCSQKITEILQNAVKRADIAEFSDSKNDSYYSQQTVSAKEEVVNVKRERSFSYAVDAIDLLKQKALLKPAQQSSNSSCINALLNTGVADILKRVINKRRDVFAPTEESHSVTRSSFSGWSSEK